MVDNSPWMRRTGWLREFAGKDMATIVKKSLKPTKEEEGLQLIWRSVGRVLDSSDLNRALASVIRWIHRLYLDSIHSAKRHRQLQSKED